MTPEGYDRVYSYAGSVAHLRRYGEQPYGVACGVFPSMWSHVLGTGNQREYDKAARLPLCKRCVKVLDIKDVEG